MITVLKFYADWCGPCRAMQPTWEKLQEEYGDEVIFQSVDIESNPNLRAQYNIRSIPTLVVIQGGVEIAKKQGGGTLAELVEWLDGQGDL